MIFQTEIASNLVTLYHSLANFNYVHGPYSAFNISDPKPSNIHKATVRDRLLHRAIYRKLYPFFDKTFANCSFSCRVNKGTHRAIKDFCSASHQVSKNNTKTCWVLKEVIESFCTKSGIGLPLGNLTSQLLVNIYLNEFDQFVKHQLKAKYYIRYADDFVLMAEDKVWLEQQIPLIKNFLWERLKLILHPQKVSIKTIASGIDFLGWVNFPDHKVIRTSTKRRLIKRIKGNPTPETIASYLGLLSHGNTHKIQKEIFGSMFFEQILRE